MWLILKNKTEIIFLCVISFILTMAITVQVKTVRNNGTTISASKAETNLKTQVLKMKEKYENEYSELERKQEELEKTRKSATSNDEELTNIENTIKLIILCL